MPASRPIDCAVKLEVKLPEGAISPAVRAYLAKYAAELCADFDLAVPVDLSLTPASPQHAASGLFHVRVNDVSCRLRWWPQLRIRERAPADEVATIVAVALWENRGLLISRAISRKIAESWPSPKDSKDATAWADRFHDFLLLFLKYNHSLKFAERFLRNNCQAANSLMESSAEDWFERALEASAGLRYGASIALADPEAAQRQTYSQRFQLLLTRLRDSPGLMVGNATVTSAPLRDGEFQIRLNDVRLPVMAGPSIKEMILLVRPQDVEKLGADVRRLVDPLNGAYSFCAAASNEMGARLHEAGIDTWSDASAVYVTRVLELALLACGGSFLSPSFTIQMTNRLRDPDRLLLQGVRDGLGKTPAFHRRLTAVLRRLLDEEVPISDLRVILESLACLIEQPSRAKDLPHVYYSVPGGPRLEIAAHSLADLSVSELACAARLGARSVAARFLPEVGCTLTSRWLSLPLPLEQELINRQSAGELALSDELAEQVRTQVAQRVLLEAIWGPLLARGFAVLVAQEVRAAVAAALRREFPFIAVAGREELSATLWRNSEIESEPPSRDAESATASKDSAAASEFIVPEIFRRPIDQPPQALPVSAPVTSNLEAGIPRFEQVPNHPYGDIGLNVALAASYASRGLMSEGIQRLQMCLYRSDDTAGKQALARGSHLVGRMLAGRAQYHAAAHFVLLASAVDPYVPLYDYDLAQIWDALGNSERAILSCREAARLSSTSPIWQAALGKMFRDRQAFEDAISCYRLAASLDANNAEYHNLLANSCYSAGAYRKAIDGFRRAAEIEPAVAMFHSNLADALTMQGDYTANGPAGRGLFEEAVTRYRQALSIEPRNVRFLHHLSWPLSRLRRFADAASTLREAVDLDPKIADLRVELADSLSKQGKYGEAAQELESAIASGLGSPQVQEALAKAYLGAEEYDKAVAAAQALARDASNVKEASPGKPANRFADFASSAALARDLARKVSPSAPSLLPAAELADANYRLGAWNASLGNLRAAIVLYRRAIALLPGNPDYHKQLGNVLYKEFEHAAAIAEWKEVHPLDALTWNNIGTAYDALGEFKNALESYAASAALPEATFVPYYNIGSLNYRQRDWEASRDAFETCVRLRPDYPHSHYHLGNCHYRLNEADKAANEWRAAIGLNSTLAEAYFNLGVAAWRAGETNADPSAANYWTLALRSDRNFAVAEDNLDAIKEKREPELEIFDVIRTK
jgi:tetratricopeptide (TPR) repeat protein